MFCELKQAVPLLERELTPVEIRIGRGTPSWVVETGTPTFYHPVRHLVCGFAGNGLTIG